MNVVSFGGGTNSTAMIIGMYLHKIPIDLILFADTGGEQPHTYEFIETFNGWLEKHGLPQITSVQYHDKDGNRLTLEQECINSGTLPSIAYGFKRCSLKHKIGTQEKFCNNYQPCKEVWASGQRVQKYIGYDAGETRRIQHAAPIDEADKKYEKHYPLYEWGWTREECVRVIERAGLPKPGKSSCFFCPSMKKKEIQALWENHPDLFQRAIDLEHGAAATSRTVKGLGRDWSWESYWQAHGSTVVYKGGWKNDRAGREYAYDVRYWRQLPERIAAVAERLKDAQIEQAPAVDVIRRFRHPDVLIYADPPYMLHTRKGKQYIVEMAEEAQHIELLDALKEHPGPVILSGYDNDLYNEHLQGWKKLHRRAQAEGGAVRTETVWLNYVPETGGKVYETV